MQLKNKSCSAPSEEPRPMNANHFLQQHFLLNRALKRRTPSTAINQSFQNSNFPVVHAVGCFPGYRACVCKLCSLCTCPAAREARDCLGPALHCTSVLIDVHSSGAGEAPISTTVTAVLRQW